MNIIEEFISYFSPGGFLPMPRIRRKRVYRGPGEREKARMVRRMAQAGRAAWMNPAWPEEVRGRGWAYWLLYSQSKGGRGE